MREDEQCTLTNDLFASRCRVYEYTNEHSDLELNIDGQEVGEERATRAAMESFDTPARK